ncbi:MAG: FHA domain-containing protein [Candidatus Competibacteraceae bacterium]|nr:FHA domain-containing protein [Candidatus Competibacteraceae bacterium]
MAGDPEPCPVNAATAQERYTMSAEAMERLVVLSGPLEGHAIAIEGVVSIGRSPDNSLQLDDLQVSRKHAQVERTSRGTILRDLGSGNGTYVGTRRILEYKLANGDLIQIGSQQLRFEGEVAAAVEPELKPESGVRFQSKMARNVEAADAASIFQTFLRPATAPPPPTRCCAAPSAV